MTAGVDPMSAPMFCARIAVISAAVVAFVPMCGDSTAAFAELVTYYRTVLKDKGDLVFQDPPTHMFEVGKFNNDTMAFPPGVTIKDFASGGSQGYANPKPGAQPARFPSLIMIVPAPPGAAR